jgi:hypothetical protein
LRMAIGANNPQIFKAIVAVIAVYVIKMQRNSFTQPVNNSADFAHLFF